MKPKLLLSTFFCALFIFSCNSQSIISDLDFLEGTWKIENKDTYETWEKDSEISFIGSSYKLKNEERKVTETLAIILKERRIISPELIPSLLVWHFWIISSAMLNS